MNNLETDYRINEQGMIVEVIEKLEANESEEKADPQSTDTNAIPGDVVNQN